MPFNPRTRRTTRRTLGPVARRSRRTTMMARKTRMIYRSLGLRDTGPTFVETFKAPAITLTKVNPSDGYARATGVFGFRISDIPQWLQYAALYKQYRINYFKVMLLADFGDADQNAAAAGFPESYGNPRIAWVVADSPNNDIPTSETDVLTDNGCKVMVIKNKWSASCRPVADVGVEANQTPTSIVSVRQKYKQWFNFSAPELPGVNPVHEGIKYWISQATGQSTNTTLTPYIKISFSLRDPQ